MGTLQISSVFKFSPMEDQDLSTPSSSQKKMILNYLNMKPQVSLRNLQPLHGYSLKTGLFRDHYIAGCLIKCYANSELGCHSTLIHLLGQVNEPNVFVWNSVIRGFLEHELFSEVLVMYHKMIMAGSKPNKYTFPLLFRACTVEKAIEEGLQIHAHAVKVALDEDTYIASAGVHMYASLGRLDEARLMLDSSGNSDVICCNAMINGYMKYGEVKAGLKLFQGMKEKNVGSWNTVITGLFNNGLAGEARKLFDKMGQKDEVSWSVMIDGYNKIGWYTEALQVFSELQNQDKHTLTKFTLPSVLSSCANAGALEQGKWIHGFIRRRKITIDAVIGTSLIDMYAKCGELSLAWEVFETIQQKQVSCWNAMMGALASHGQGRNAIALFSKMLNCVRPNEITFISLLNACAHSGLVEEGLRYFLSMKSDHGIEPRVEHYGCIVNLLAKTGYMEAAEELVDSMPMSPNAAILGALLGTRRLQGKTNLADKMGKIMLKMEPENSGRYTLLSNIYAEAGDFEEVGKVRKLMKETDVRTVTGSSMITVNGVVHEFRNGDSGHSEIIEIHQILEIMMQQIKSKQGDTSLDLALNEA